jgi:hypothetical protein
MGKAKFRIQNPEYRIQNEEKKTRLSAVNVDKDPRYKASFAYFSVKAFDLLLASGFWLLDSPFPRH